MKSLTPLISALASWLLLSISSLCLAQQPLVLSVYSESTSMPFTTLVTTPVHPGFQAGTEFTVKETHKTRLYPAVNIGYLFHRKLYQGIYVNAELGFDIKVVSRFNLKSKLGLGYLRTFTTRKEYQLIDGKYVSQNDTGNSRVMPSFSFGLGYLLKKEEIYSPEVFILHQTWLEYPYSPGFIPLMAHTNLHLGIKFFPIQN